jgi:hypothetical protein
LKGVLEFSNLVCEFASCALGLLVYLKKTREVKGACQVEATSITSVVKGVMVVIPKWKL